MSQRGGLRTAAAVVVTVLGIGAALLAVLVVGMRWKVTPVIDAVRRLNRSVTNPRVMRTAGSVDTPTSLIRHVGRISGRAYETPVDTIATLDGILIALPYGTRADWVRNVLAAGSATVVSRGESFAVEAPVITTTDEVADRIPPRTRATLRIFGVSECLFLSRSADGPR